VPKVYRDKNGDRMVVAAGGEIICEPGALLQMGNPTGAADYVVDLNVSATGSGSLAEPFSTIAEAITASNTSIGLTANRWWARRNRIFVMGDGITESLTVLPEKCDIIGMGSDLYPFPRIIGAHTIALAKVACRFINIGFQATGTGDLFVAPAGCHGLSFLDCVATPATAGNTKAFEITDSAHVRIQGTKIITSAGAISTSIFAVGISIEGTASIHDFSISDNPMIFATAGVAVANGTAQGSDISRNTIRAVGGLCINDDSDDVACIDNRLISSNGGLVEAQICDWNPLLAVGNTVTTDSARNAAIPTIIVLTS